MSGLENISPYRRSTQMSSPAHRNHHRCNYACTPPSEARSVSTETRASLSLYRIEAHPISTLIPEGDSPRLPLI